MTIILSLLVLLLLLFPSAAGSSAKAALHVWGTDVVPSLFPYMVLTKALSGKLAEKKLPPAVSCLCIALISLFGGAPSGASSIRTMLSYNSISLRHARILSCLTGVVSPMFILHTLHLWGIPLPHCILLFLSQVCASVFYAGMCLMIKPVLPPPRKISSPSLSGSTDFIESGISSILHVGASIVLFSTLAGLLSVLFPLPVAFKGVLHALLEIAGGMHTLCPYYGLTAYTPVLFSFLLSVSGLSVISQNAFFLSPYGIRFSHLLKDAAVRGVLAACLMGLLSRLCLP